MELPIRNAHQMIAAMRPQLQEGAFVFCSTNDVAQIALCSQRAVGMFVEAEGRSFILKLAEAQSLGFKCDLPMRQITLQVHSALDGVGLTAAVATKLAQRAIPCNMVAAYCHDHLFVPANLAEEALSALLELQSS